MASKPNALVYFGPGNTLATLRSERESLIHQRAYFKALERHFAPGHEVEDWLTAEEEVDNWLRLLRPD